MMVNTIIFIAIFLVLLYVAIQLREIAKITMGYGTGVEIPDDEYDGSDYLNDPLNLADVLNAQKPSTPLESSPKPPETMTSFFDLFAEKPGVEVITDKDEINADR